MIDTVTLSATGDPNKTFMALTILLIFVVIDILLILCCEIRHDSDAANLTLLVTGVATVVLPIVIFLLPGSSLTFDNNSGYIQAIKGDKPITEVLDGKDKLTVPCVFVDAGKKVRHDCTFIRKVGTTYEVWDTDTYKNHKVLKPES